VNVKVVGAKKPICASCSRVVSFRLKGNLVSIFISSAELFIYSEQKPSVCRSVCDIKWWHKS